MATKPPIKYIKTGKGLGKGSWLLFKKIRMFLIFLVFGLILINACIICFEAKDIQPGVEYLGKKFFFATERLGEESLKVIEQEGLTIEGEGFFKNSWIVISYFWGIISALFIIYIWIKILQWILLRFPIMDTSKKPTAGVLAIFTFMGLQALYIAIFTDKTAFYHFQSFWWFVKSLRYIIEPVINVANGLLGGGEELINETIEQSLGNMTA